VEQHVPHGIAGLARAREGRTGVKPQARARMRGAGQWHSRREREAVVVLDATEGVRAREECVAGWERGSAGRFAVARSGEGRGRRG